MGVVTHNELDYDQITDQIFVGSNPWTNDEFSQELIDKGVNANVSLQNSSPGSQSKIHTILHLPVEQGAAPSQEQLLQGTSAIKSMMDAGNRVYIHCKYGSGRAPTMTAAYLIYNGYTTDEAIELIETNHKSTNILSNQEKALREFEKTIRKQG